MPIVYRIIQVTSVILIGVVSFLGCSSRMSGNIDFPCSYSGMGVYNKPSNCYITPKNRVTPSGIRIEAWLDYHKAFWSGVGCSHEHTSNDVLVLPDLKLERIDKVLKVNGQVLETGKEYYNLAWFNSEPWLDSYIRFTNYGAIPNCDADASTDRILIVGESGTQPSSKGFLVLFILGLAMIFSTWRLRNIKK